MVLEVETPVHVVDARRDLVPVRHHPEEEGPAVGDDGLADAGHAQRVTAELVRAKHQTSLVTAVYRYTGNPAGAAANL